MRTPSRSQQQPGQRRASRVTPRRRQGRAGWVALAGAIVWLCLGSQSPDQASANAGTLEGTRLTMGKWIETQQVISRERNDWQQGKEVLVGRLELLRKEVVTLEEKIAAVQLDVAEAEQERQELLRQDGELQAAGTQLSEAVTAMESEVERLFGGLPEPIRQKLEPLHQRIPSAPATTRVAVAERFQNVLGILDALNKANTEITVSYEVHSLADGRPAEVKAIYVGLAQAYFVGSAGEAGIGRPSADGWRWEPAPGIAGEVSLALEILEGKHSPAFVSLPVELR